MPSNEMLKKINDLLAYYFINSGSVTVANPSRHRETSISYICVKCWVPTAMSWQLDVWIKKSQLARKLIASSEMQNSVATTQLCQFPHLLIQFSEAELIFIVLAVEAWCCWQGLVQKVSYKTQSRPYGHAEDEHVFQVGMCFENGKAIKV